MKLHQPIYELDPKWWETRTANRDAHTRLAYGRWNIVVNWQCTCNIDKPRTLLESPSNIPVFPIWFCAICMQIAKPRSIYMAYCTRRAVYVLIFYWLSAKSQYYARTLRVNFLWDCRTLCLLGKFRVFALASRCITAMLRTIIPFSWPTSSNYNCLLISEKFNDPDWCGEPELGERLRDGLQRPSQLCTRIREF